MNIQLICTLGGCFHSHFADLRVGARIISYLELTFVSLIFLADVFPRYHKAWPMCSLRHHSFVLYALISDGILCRLTMSQYSREPLGIIPAQIFLFTLSYFVNPWWLFQCFPAFALTCDLLGYSWKQYCWFSVGDLIIPRVLLLKLKARMAPYAQLCLKFNCLKQKLDRGT